MRRQCLPIMVLARSREFRLLSAGLRCLGPELTTEELLRLPQPGDRTARADFRRPQPLLHGWKMARVRNATAKTFSGAQFPLNDSDRRHLEPWLRKIDNLDMHPLWELVFGMPPEWFGHDRAAVTGILGSLESRVWDLRMALHHWGKPAKPPGDKRSPRSVGSALPIQGIALCG